MYRYVVPFPVMPGKEDQAKQLAETLKSRPDEYRESRKAAGILLERAYYQQTPAGDCIVVYQELTRPIGELFASVAQSDLQIDKEFVRAVAEAHGVDLTAPPAGPPPETIGEWTDPEATDRREGHAFCVPVIPGREEAGKAFTNEAMGDRLTEFTQSRRALNGTAEVVCLTQTPMGTFACVYVEGTDPIESNARFAASTSPFDVWFKQQLSTLFPPEIDFSQPVPVNTLLLDSTTMIAAPPQQITLQGDKAATQRT